MAQIFGPATSAGEFTHAWKYRSQGESFREAMTRIASALSDSETHFKALREILLEMRFLPAGRIQSAIGSIRRVTPYNCFVSGSIEDSYTDGHGSIMARATEAAQTMRYGGGIGYDFSTLRPRGALIRKLSSKSSGPVSFIEIFDAIGRATASSGHRRGAQMGVLRVDHPDILEFVRAKQNEHRFATFNLSVAVTDEFMRAVESDSGFNLRWNGNSYGEISARDLWNGIMRSTYDWSEPGVLFIDTINRRNNLYYCETIAATNPCGEQPLPPYGACLLGSFNLVKYLARDSSGKWEFDYVQFFTDIPHVVRAMDKVVDVAIYPMHEQEQEAQRKRRMGLGVTGLANTIEALGAPYASPKFLDIMRSIFAGLRDTCYLASAELAAEKGPFPLFDRDKYLAGEFIPTVSSEAREAIKTHGIRNSHLLSIAPTGTISFCADNVSSGIEPVFAHEMDRTIMTFDGPRQVEVTDYGYKFLGVNAKTAEECTAHDHIAVLSVASYYMDSAVTKTCNVPEEFPWEDFKDFYHLAWKNGCKGCTTYRTGCLRGAILKAKEKESGESKDTESSCSVDPVTGRKSCE